MSRRFLTSDPSRFQSYGRSRPSHGIDANPSQVGDTDHREHVRMSFERTLATLGVLVAGLALLGVFASR